MLRFGGTNFRVTLLVLAILAILLLLFVKPANGQFMVLVQPGLVQYFEGEVLVDGKQITGQGFYQLRDGEVFSTGVGRAEILLVPGVFLRVSERSYFKVVSKKKF